MNINGFYECEYFDFERSAGKDVNSISCKLRGRLDPTKRSDPATRPPIVALAQARADLYIDDGTRVVRIIGC